MRFAYVFDLQLVGCCGVQQGYGLIDAQGVLDAEIAATASLEGIQMCSAAQFLSQVAGKGPDICPLAAGHADDSSRQSQGGVVSDVYSVRSGLGGGGENRATPLRQPQ